MSQSRRSTPLPRGWAATRRRILRAHDRICHLCGGSGASEVDHVIPAYKGGGDDDDNLAPIHRDCHRAKTAAEAAAARGHHTRRRPPEPHPGDTEGAHSMIEYGDRAR